MFKIAKGSREAWAARHLMEAWLAQDADALESELRAADPVISKVIHLLIIVAGGAVQAVATLANLTYEEVLPDLWGQLAQSQKDDDAARLMRSAITAWTSGDDLATALNESGAFDEVDSDDLVLNFLGFSEMVGRRLTESLHRPFSYATDGWWEALGVQGRDPYRAG